MSSFENYEATSRHYDKTRVPVGSEIILGCLSLLPRKDSGLELLDAGCGTGAYSEAVLSHVGSIAAIDMSAGMLATARAKLAKAEAAGRIGFHRGSITSLPFEDESFDAVMINQVVHHLGDTAENAFANLGLVLREVSRVLRRGGGFLLNHCAHEQLRHAYWYNALIPEALERCCAHFAPLETVRELMAKSGLAYHGAFAPLDAICQGEAYRDPQGPLSSAWRAGDSIWAHATEAELDRVEKTIADLEARGEMDAFLAENDARRAAIGQITILFARKG